MEVLGRHTIGDTPSAVAIGTFDGMHLGHQQLMRHLRALADAEGLTPAVVTFDRHPASVVPGRSAPKLLTTNAEKFAAMAACGIERVHIVRFDEQCSTELPEEFAVRVLVRQAAARLVAVGQNFRFGRDRQGDVERLHQLGRRLGFAVERVALRADHGGAVSSTRIRSLIAGGDVAGAAALLGRSHQVPAIVMPGRARCRDRLRFAVPGHAALPDRGDFVVSVLGLPVLLTVEMAGEAAAGMRLVCELDADAELQVPWHHPPLQPGTTTTLGFLRPASSAAGAGSLAPVDAQQADAAPGWSRLLASP